MSDIAECRACRFFDGDRTGEARNKGRCVRYPPVPLRGNATDYSRWPDVDYRDWCGEFQPPPPNPLSENVAEWAATRGAEPL